MWSVWSVDTATGGAGREALVALWHSGDRWPAEEALLPSGASSAGYLYLVSEKKRKNINALLLLFLLI